MIEVGSTPLGRIAVEPKALESLVRDAADRVDGARVVRPGRTLRVSLGEDGKATASLSLSAARRMVLPDVGRLVQARVSVALATALGAPPERVDVAIERIEE